MIENWLRSFGSNRARRRFNTDHVIIAAVAASAVLSALVLVRVTGLEVLAAGVGAAALALAGLALVLARLYPQESRVEPQIDWSIVRAAAAGDEAPVAITGKDGRLVAANAAFSSLFGESTTPPMLGFDGGGTDRLTAAGRTARRDGSGSAADLRRDGRRFNAEILRSGGAGECLIWRMAPVGGVDMMAVTIEAIAGAWGDRLAEAGVMAALIGGEGRIRAANRALILRALGRLEAPVAGRDFVSLLSSDSKGLVRFANEGLTGGPLRLLQMPLDVSQENGPRIVALLDDDISTGTAADLPLQTLIGMLPLGLALTDRDGRFLSLNQAFSRAAGIAPGSTPVYPGDLVIREDKAVLADAVRRYASGQAVSGDLAIRLKDRPDEPVALTLAGARGLGEAAVLLSLKDNSEESRLKREVAQATKMQAVGQLAGGVAHDFNNILTGIIGHCDLMLMRHTPGDSDYDDIQQIRINSNRAAALTRQLLAFSRQQTLRPQVLQLPDVISEVSNLLQRLLGETVSLVIQHGRGLGAVRADPGQLEQVIVNLAVNARDAMLAKGSGGTLTLETYAVTTTDVRKLDLDVLPVAEYTAMKLTDTGTGIAPDVLGKIFEPFFTTKEVGKGTGLGLSTVYGIVKQSNGFIFADSEIGKGTSFTVYLPVHREVQIEPVIPTKIEKSADLWGSETILLVEDEDMVRTVAERALSRNGYTVLAAENGEEALAILEGEDGAIIDLLISDVVMPVMDGPTLVRHAREKYPELPILFMSGYAEEQLRKSIDIANVNFLPKPFSVKQLAEAAQQALAAIKA
jgi:two-component system, cell cycle sensor histidine kinase and response regulator CckA